MHEVAEGRGAQGRAALAQKQIALIGLEHDFRAIVTSLSLLNSPGSKNRSYESKFCSDATPVASSSDRPETKFRGYESKSGSDVTPDTSPVTRTVDG